MVLSKDGLNGPLSGFSTIAHDGLADVFGSSASNIKVDSGLSLIAAFEKSKSTGVLADGFSRMGLNEERVVMTGDIGGLFGGPTKLSIDVVLSGHTGAKHQPGWMAKKPGVEAVFSMIATDTEGQFDIEFGIGVDVITTLDHTPLDMEAKVALEIEDEKADVKIVAKLKDKNGWNRPFGIPGFTLYGAAVDLGIDEDGGVHFGFYGDIKVGHDTYTVATDADFVGIVPTNIAFVASATELDMFFIEEIAIAMMGENFSLNLPKGILPTFTGLKKDPKTGKTIKKPMVKFAFVTPNASDPDLNITGEGFAMSGAMNWLGHELGSMDVSVSPTKGIYASASIDDMHVGPLELEDNHFTMDIKLTGVPTLNVRSNIEFFGISEHFLVSFSNTGATIDADVTFGPDFSMTSDLTLSGIDLSVKKPSFTHADFAIAGDFQMDIGKFVAGPATAALNDVFHELDAAFKAGEKKVKSARKKVNGLTTKINAEREKVRKEKAKAEARVQDAENRVNSLKSTIDGEWKHYHHCHGWGKWPCRIRWAIEIGATKVAKDVADEALILAKSLISHFPIDLDPRVAVLIAERDVARGVLTLALDIIEGADALDGFLKKATDKLTNDLKNSININKASFNGDMRGIITGKKPVDLSINAEFFGATIKDSFAFNIHNVAKDIGKDVEHVALLGLYALHNLVDKGLNDLPKPLRNKLKGAIAKRFDGARAKNKRRMAKYNLDFNKYNAAAELIQADYAAYSLASIQAELSKHANPLDSDVSETITDELVEVGHSGLCLTNIGNLVKQHTCTNGADRKWSTKPATGAAGVKAGLGYVYITQKSTGKCIVPEGKWATVSTKFGDFTFPEQQFQGDGNINIETCVNTKEYYWKVLKHGDGWMQMANLATNKCLHFSNSNALPGRAQAEWKSCIGSANQVYRLADNTTPSYHPDNIVLKATFADACPEKPNKNKKLYMTNCDEGRRFDYSVDIRGNVKFISRASGKCLQPDSYNPHAQVVERTCTQLDYQWWTPVQKPGGWKLQNAQTKYCMQFLGRGHSLRMDQCHDYALTLITPVIDQATGITIADGTSANVRSAPNAALAGMPEFKICLMDGMNGANESQVTGVYKDGKCSVWFLGRTFHSDNQFKVVTRIKNSEWLDAKGSLPMTAISIGSKVGPRWGSYGGGKSAYACRTESPGGSSVGWTIDGISCFYIDGGPHKSTTFAVLSRTPSKAMMFNFTDSKSIVYATSTAHVEADVASEDEDGSCHAGAYAGDGARTTDWRDLTFTSDMDAAVNWNNGSAYFFKGDKYVNYNINTDRQRAGYPLNIRDHWSGLSFTNDIDAAVNFGNNKVYFFKGDEYVAYNHYEGRQDPGYPKKIRDQWSGLSFTSDIDAAINWGNGTVYFFKGAEYVSYNIAKARQDPGYPKRIAGNWEGVYGSNINSAVIWKNFTERKHAFFFKGDHYKRYNVASWCVK